MKTLGVSFVVVAAGVQFLLWYQSPAVRVLGLLWVMMPHAFAAGLGYLVERDGEKTKP